jgi:hypothetical protein
VKIIWFLPTTKRLVELRLLSQNTNNKLFIQSRLTSFSQDSYVDKNNSRHKKELQASKYNRKQITKNPLPLAAGTHSGDEASLAEQNHNLDKNKAKTKAKLKLK